MVVEGKISWYYWYPKSLIRLGLCADSRAPLSQGPWMRRSVQAAGLYRAMAYFTAVAVESTNLGLHLSRGHRRS